MADYADFYKQASALLKGKKNAASGRTANAGIRGKLASAMYKGKAAERNNILARYGAANGAPAAAAVAAGAAVAAAAAPAAGSAKVTEANAVAAKAAMNAALVKAGTTRKASIAAASKYAKLLKEGDKRGAKEYLEMVIEKASKAGADAAAAAAVKAAKANVGMSNDEIAGILRRNLGKGARPANISKFKQEIAAGKSVANAVTAVQQMRKNAALKTAATKKAKKANTAAAVAAVNATGAAGAALVVPAKTAKKALVKAAKIPQNIRPVLPLAMKNLRNYGTRKVGVKKNNKFAGIYNPYAANVNNSPLPNFKGPNFSARRRRSTRRRRN